MIKECLKKQKIVEQGSCRSIGVILISDYIRVEWLVVEGVEGNAFDRCDGFRIETDDMFKRAKIAQ